MSQSTTPNPPAVNADTAPQYAPIAWTAVASLTVAIFFVLILLAGGGYAYIVGQPLLVPLLLVLPFIAVVLAFVARRQIRVAEGTTTGESYANAGWWIAVMTGLSYLAYFGAIEFSIRQETSLQFDQWTSHLAAMDPNNPDDAEFYAAVYYLLPGAAQTSAGNPRNTELIRDLASEDGSDTQFRHSEFVQVCLRNPGEITFESRGLKSWEQLPEQIQCIVSGSVTSPEGEHSIEVSMVQVLNNDRKDAKWEFRKTGKDFVTARWLTPYGWHIDYLLRSAQGLGYQYTSTLTQPDRGTIAFLTFMEQGGSPESADAYITTLLGANDGLSSLAGGIASTFEGLPRSESWNAFRQGKMFKDPNGDPLEPGLARRLLEALDTPGMVQRAGGIRVSNADTTPLIRYTDDRITVRFPIEIADPSQNNAAAPSAATGALVLEATQADNPEQFEMLKEEKANWKAAEQTVKPTIDYKDTPLKWRIIAIETDMKMVENAPDRQPMQ